MTSPWNLIGNNRIVMEIIGEIEVDKRWRKMPQRKSQEWKEVNIHRIYNLKCGVDELEVNYTFTDQFFPLTPKAGNDGYKLNDFLSRDSKGMTMVIKFMVLTLFPKQPSQARIGVIMTIIKSYMGQHLVNQANQLKDVIGRLGNDIYDNKGCPITMYAMHIYHNLNLLTKEKLMTYIDISRDQEFNFIEDPTITSDAHIETEQEKPTREEDDTTEMVGINIVETLAAMIDKKLGEYIQLEPQAKRKYDGDDPSQSNKKKHGGLTLDSKEMQEYENSDEQVEQDSKRP